MNRKVVVDPPRLRAVLFVLCNSCNSGNCSPAAQSGWEEANGSLEAHAVHAEPVLHLESSEGVQSTAGSLLTVADATAGSLLELFQEPHGQQDSQSQSRLCLLVPHGPQDSQSQSARPCASLRSSRRSQGSTTPSWPWVWFRVSGFGFRVSDFGISKLFLGLSV